VAQDRRNHHADPAPLVETAFRRIHDERMAGLPLLNPALHVEAVGFQRWQGNWLGVLVTPWAMSLLLLPGPEGDWEYPVEGRRRIVPFPSGDYAFLGGYEPEIGEYQTCALISPLSGFSDQETACQTGREALSVLLQAKDNSAGDSPASPSRRRFFAGDRRRAP
jgi:[NiFe] hydrogenase assembly HybE family chaperone